MQLQLVSGAARVEPGLEEALQRAQDVEVGFAGIEDRAQDLLDVPVDLGTIAPGEQ
jgi:hypothetical protein